jgi:hypothetical protein
MVKRTNRVEELMANGKPGDDPIKDIIHYKLPVFSPTIDALIAEIVELGGRLELEVKLINKDPKAPLDVLEAELRALRDKYQEKRKGKILGIDD